MMFDLTADIQQLHRDLTEANAEIAKLNAELESTRKELAEAIQRGQNYQEEWHEAEMACRENNRKIVTLTDANLQLHEWQTNIRSIIVEMSRQHPVLEHAWAGDKNGWGYNFEWIKWVATRAVKAGRELAELREKLPKTADGVTVVPGMALYRPELHAGRRVHAVNANSCFMDLCLEEPWCAEYCYSKESLAVAERERRAALAAKKGQ